MCRFSPLLLFRDRHAGQCVSEHCPVDTRFGAVVRKQYFGPDNPGCLDEHRIVHRIGYIFRQKGDVDSLQPGHFRNQFGISGNVNAERVDLHYISVSFARNVERLAGGTHVDDVVGRGGPDRNSVPCCPLPVVKDGYTFQGVGYLFR